jgi:hypothetical protein
MRDIDSLVLYTTEPGTFWRVLGEVARAAGVVWHREPPEVAIEVGTDCRLYIHEGAPTQPVPDQAQRLGPAMREVVIDRHNRLQANAFLADVMDRVPGLVDADDDGRVVPMVTFAAAIRAGERP